MLELSIVIGASFFFEIHFEKEWIRMKRMLAYSSIGQIGYVIIGIIELLLALPSSTSSRPIFLGFNRTPYERSFYLLLSKNNQIPFKIKQFHRIENINEPHSCNAQDTLF
ncbi:hypothetical protein ACJX0J_003212 [Zea mays]